MLFGVFANNSALIDQQADNYRKILDQISFQRCSEVDVRHKNLQFTLLRHESLPEQDSYFIDLERDVVVVVSGNIFNLPFLLKEENLENLSPAEFINHVYHKNQLDFLSKLIGGYSILIADIGRAQVYAIKDVIGTVPISYGQRGEYLYFCSDTHGLSKGLFGNEDINEEFIHSRFYDYENNYVQTPNSHIKKVSPAHYVKVQNDSIELIRYWDPTTIDIDNSIEFNEAVNQLRELVLSSVKMMSQEDYTAGTHISGGLDSTLIATLAKSNYPKQAEFHAFTWSPSNFQMNDDLPFDERENLKEQCRIAGLVPVFTNIDVNDYHNFVANWRAPSEAIFEGPVLKNANEIGVNLLFSGWGGDEFIGLRDEALLYESFRSMHMSNFFKLFRRKGMKAKIMHVVNNALLPSRRREYFKYKIRPSVYQYLKNGIKSNELDTDKFAWYRSKKDYQIGLINYNHIAQRCEDWYINGQRNGVVYRYPLLDKRIIEYTLKLDVGLFVDEKIDRPIMRAICKDLITEKIRALQKQNDPVTMRNAMEVQQQAFKVYLEQFPEFKANSYLSFVNLDRLEKDLRAEIKADGQISKKLGFALYYVKVVHEYVRNYHEGMTAN